MEKTPNNKGRRDFLKALPFIPFIKPFNLIEKDNLYKNKESFNFEPEKVFKEARAFYKEYLESDDYFVRLKLLFYRADKFRNSTYTKGESFEDTFGDFDVIKKEFENLKEEEQNKYISKAISFKIKKINEVDNIKYKFFDSLSTDLIKSKTIQACVINLINFRKILSKVEKAEQIEALNMIFTPEITKYILEIINFEEINNLLLIKNPNTTLHPNIFFQDIIHELVHLDYSKMPFINDELFTKTSEEKINNNFLLLLKNEEEKNRSDYLSETPEIEAYFQSMLIMLKKYKLIDSYNNIPNDIFTKLDEKYDEILEKLSKEKDKLSEEEYRFLTEKAIFLSNYGGILDYLKRMLQINTENMKNVEKDEPIKLTEKDAFWLLKNLASGDDFRELNKNIV